MKQLLVIGGASFDILHLEGQTVSGAGGAGMYTTMAAIRCGAKVSMFSPCPDPMPDILRPVAQNLTEWLGPTILPEQLPRFEIAYRGVKTEYLTAFLGAESDLSPELLPEDLTDYDLVHVCPFDDALKQLSFIMACRNRGAQKISSGTGLFIVEKQAEAVREVVEASDCSFMNEQEATAVFGSCESAHTAPGKVLFITLGDQGASIIQGDTATFIPAVPTTELDPTGAGDTFCGATLAYLLQNKHPVMAARHAAVLASEMITQIGPTALLSRYPAPKEALDGRIELNCPQVRSVARQIATIAEVAPYQFTSPELPPVGHPKTVDYFFAATLQQFSFWTERDGRYERPLIAKLGGVERKGSDYLWETYRRAVEQDPDFCSPERQADLSRQELLAVFRADDGTDPMPALDLHLQQARQYGRDMLALQLTPQIMLEHALASTQPLQTFLSTLDHIGGYKEDPLRKKSSLLALILNQRPEKFLPLRDDEQIAPVIDYHLMRSALRIGLIE